MFRIIAVTAMAALAAAQSEFSANDGSINVETREGMTVARRQQISVFELSSVVANLQSQLGAANTENSVLRAQQVNENSLIREQMAALGGSDSPLALGVQAIANDLTARTTGLIETTAANTHRLDSLASAVSTAQVTVATVPSTLAATVNTMTNTMDARINTITNTMDAQVNTLTNTMDARISTVLGSLASTATALTASQEAGASTLTASVGTQLTRVNTSIRAVNVALAGKRSAAQHVWIGYCSSYQNGGWREYCFDRVQADTARPMFRKENNNRMRSIMAGYYHVYFARMVQSCNWEYTLLYFDGNHRVHTHGWQGTHSWTHHYANMIYPLAANKQFWARAWTGCWNVWHDGFQYTHFHAQYAGAIPA